MIDSATHVCPRCGRPARDGDFCECGTNLAVMRGMLPNRAQWEAANPDAAAEAAQGSAAPGLSDVPEPPPTRAPGLSDAPEPPPTQPDDDHRLLRAVLAAGRASRKPPGAGSSRLASRQARIISSVAVLVLFAVILIVGSTSHKHTPTIRSSPTTTAPAVPTRAPAPPLGPCIAGWNAGRSPEHRHILDLKVLADHPPVAVVATYAGAARRLARFGGGSPVVLSPGACVVVAHDFVFIEQPSGHWGLVRASAAGPFSAIAAAPRWTVAHANAAVAVGLLRTHAPGLGTIARRGGRPVVISSGSG